jgi:hypothetical protein
MTVMRRGCPVMAGFGRAFDPCSSTEHVARAPAEQPPLDPKKVN